MSWYDYNEYVPVAVRRERALKKMQQLMADGEEIQPIEPFKTRTIAKSFWGKAWCRHIEAFSDYSNRLPRGRTYVRNGSVCHLGIEQEVAQAMVSGSSMYELSIHVDELCPEKWSNIKNDCRGKIGSLIELLQGKISDEIMAIVTDKQNGLFPHPSEIRFNCNCPDWADMCKHVAAVMYGIGVRLDAEPELLFKLRGVNHEELISVESTVDQMTSGRRSRRRRTVQADAVADVFGIELDEEEMPTPQTHRPRRKKGFEPTPEAIRKLRRELDLSQAKFGHKIGVSQGTITRWENSSEPLKLKPEYLEQLEKLAQ